eukprot:gene23059-27405_t
MLRVRETATAELLTNQLPKVQVFTSTPASSANDAINGKTAFTSNTHDQIQSVSVPMIEPADPDEVMPKDLQALVEGMRKGSGTNSEWWQAPGYQSLSESLPEDLVDDFRLMANDDKVA